MLSPIFLPIFPPLLKEIIMNNSVLDNVWQARQAADDKRRAIPIQSFKDELVPVIEQIPTILQTAVRSSACNIVRIHIKNSSLDIIRNMKPALSNNDEQSIITWIVDEINQQHQIPKDRIQVTTGITHIVINITK